MAALIQIAGVIALVSALFLSQLSGAGGVGFLVWLGGFLVVVAILIFALILATHYVRNFIGENWRLTALSDELAYSKPSDCIARWSVSLDQIARVESGRTVEWQRVRTFPKKSRFAVAALQASIPDAEYQVFIFATDGRRLVVHTANAAREDCGRLAHSIRSYVEQARSASPAPVASSSPAADGFDL